MQEMKKRNGHDRSSRKDDAAFGRLKSLHLVQRVSKTLFKSFLEMAIYATFIFIVLRAHASFSLLIRYRTIYWRRMEEALDIDDLLPDVVPNILNQCNIVQGTVQKLGEEIYSYSTEALPLRFPP
jgi:hypothetical protein